MGPQPQWARRAAALIILVTALFGPAPAHAGALVHVRKVTLATPASGSAEVVVATSTPPSFSARVANNGTRLLVDITDADVTGAEAAIVKGNEVVSGVMTQAYEADGQHIARVLVQLAKTAEYEIRADSSGLTISLTAAAATKPKDVVRGAPGPG
jgi:hypothetical protein